MTDIQNKVIDKISAQQGKDPKKDIFRMGQQLKRICAEEAESAEMVLQDMQNTSMSLKAMYEKINADIRKERITGLTDAEMEQRIRGFYGLPLLSDETLKDMIEYELEQMWMPRRPAQTAKAEEPKKSEPEVLSLFDLMEVL